jgi:hypothetical protein
MPFIEVPIIGSGDTFDPYRAETTLPKSAVIPTDSNGRPRFTTTIVWIPDARDKDIPRSKARIPLEAARALIRQLDPAVKVDHMRKAKGQR